MRRTIPSVISYTSYRTFLTDVMSARRKAGLPSGNRWFAQTIGITSSSWLSTIVQGKRAFPKESALAFALSTGMDQMESEYLIQLIAFNEAGTAEEANEYFARMLEIIAKRRPAQIRRVGKDQYEFYRCWYYSAVRSIVGMVRIGDDYDRLARILEPTITTREAKKALKLLSKLNLIRKDTDGCYVLTDTTLTTGEAPVRSVAVANFQRETMRMASESIGRFSHDERDISTLTVGISKESVDRIKTELAAMRRRILELAEKDSTANRVMQVNIQLFPLSKPLTHRAADPS